MNIPLFPLNTVLFPQGLLPLRVFEIRYTDMVRDCLRTQTPFGVVNIARGSEFTPPTDGAMIGTMAQIIDFDMNEPSVLMIATQGLQRFKVLSTDTQRDGLIRADVDCIDADPVLPVPDEHRASAKLLAQILKEIEAQHKHAEKQGHKPFIFPAPKPFQTDDAGWVANRFAELMPISRVAKQTLLEELDPVARLSWVSAYLKEKDVL